MNLNKKTFKKHINECKIVNAYSDIFIMTKEDFYKLFVKNNKIIYNNVYAYESATQINNLISEEEFIIFKVL